MKPAVALVSLMVFVLGPGCSPQTTQTREIVTPSTYGDYKSSLNRSVGLLRRLLVLPPQYIYLHNGKRQPEKEAGSSTLMLVGATAFLRDWKGYEIITASEIQKPGGNGLPRAQSQPDPALKPLYEWAMSSEVDSSPPAEVKDLVADLCRRFGADGVLVLQGFQKPPSTWNVATTMLTASLTWPLLLLEMKGGLQAHIYEGTGGGIVWRSSLRLFDPSKPISLGEVEKLLGSVENAVPAALIKR